MLEDALARAGFGGVRRTQVDLHRSWPSADAFASFHRNSLLRRLVADEEPFRQDAAWRAVTEAATRRWGRGPLLLWGQVLVVSAKVPG